MTDEEFRTFALKEMRTQTEKLGCIMQILALPLVLAAGALVLTVLMAAVSLKGAQHG